MYKVFLNNKTISFQRKSTIIKDSDAVVFNNLSLLETIDFLHLQAKNIDEHTFILQFEDPDAILNELKKSLGIIQAGGGIVENIQKEILFIFRRNRWDLPKGKLDKGENIETCALREVTEECGIHNIKITKPAMVTYHLFTPQTKKTLIFKQTSWYHMFFSGMEQPIAQAEEGITDIRWFSPEELHIPLSNTFALVKDLILSIK